MNHELGKDKVGLIGEYLVKIRLNTFGVNTGAVDKDTGTDIVLFKDGKILTAQVKSGRNGWNNNGVHGVHVHFMVRLEWPAEHALLDQATIMWKRIDLPDREFIELTPDSTAAIFE